MFYPYGSFVSYLEEPKKWNVCGWLYAVASFASDLVVLCWGKRGSWNITEDNLSSFHIPLSHLATSILNLNRQKVTFNKMIFRLWGLGTAQWSFSITTVNTSQIGTDPKACWQLKPLSRPGLSSQAHITKLPCSQCSCWKSHQTNNWRNLEAFLTLVVLFKCR